MRDAMDRRWVVKGSRVLDFGCGRGRDVDDLRKGGHDVVGYDPHPEFGSSARPKGLFDVVSVIYVVNVLDEIKQRRAVLEEAWGFVRKKGVMIVVSRSVTDIRAVARNGDWPRHRDGYWSRQSRGMFQKGHSVDDLRALVARLRPAEIIDLARSPYTGIIARKGNARRRG